MLRQRSGRNARAVKIRQKGAGLIEVLVAVLVLGIGVLGYAGMQLFALQSAEEASYRTHATLIGRDALERFLLNAGWDSWTVYFNAGNWPDKPAVGQADFPEGCMTSDCQGPELARVDIAQLAWSAANSLPGGMVMASDDCGGVPSPSCVVITWSEMEPADCLDDYPNIPSSRDYHCVVLEAMRL